MIQNRYAVSSFNAFRDFCFLACCELYRIA